MFSTYVHVYVYVLVCVHVHVHTCTCTVPVSCAVHLYILHVVSLLWPPCETSLPPPPVPQSYASQVKAMDVQYKRLCALVSELTRGPEVGGAEAITSEMSSLTMQWEPLKDNVNDRWAWSLRMGGCGRMG